MKTRTAKEEKIVCHSASLAGWTGAKLCEAGMQGDCKCQICGEEESSPGHFQWHCKEIAARRKQTYVCAINPDDLPAHLQMGLPGMMEKGLHQTFWGKQRDEVKTEDPEARKKMGIPVGKSAIAISESRNLEAEAMFREKGVESKELNARQAFNKVRGAIPTDSLQPPEFCQAEAPAHINVLSDGSHQYGRRPIWSMGAAGVWWPQRRLSDGDLADAEIELTHIEQDGDGLKMYTALAGYGGSSTRAELAAGIVAIASSRPVHLGTDSKAFRDKALYVLRLCKDRTAPKRAWGTHTDGDL